MLNLKPYQINTIDFIRNNLYKGNNFLVENDCGTGKTICILKALESILIINSNIKCLIITTVNSINDYVQDKEKFTLGFELINLRKLILSKKSYELSKDTNNVYLVNYELVKHIGKYDFDYLIIDEATHYNNMASLRFKSLYSNLIEGNNNLKSIGLISATFFF